MKLEGMAQIVFRNRETGKERKRIVAGNIVTNYCLTQLAQRIFYIGNLRIGIATDNEEPYYSKASVTGVLAIGKLGEVTSPQYITEVEPVFGQIANVIDGIATDRIFRSVFLGSSSLASTPNYGGGIVFNPYTYILLSEPQTQQANEQLLIYYQIKLPITGFNIPSFGIQRLGQAMFSDASTIKYDFLYLHTSGVGALELTEGDNEYVLSKTTELANYLRVDAGNSFMGGLNTPDGTATHSVSYVSSHYKYKSTIYYNRENLYTLGLIINSLYRWLDLSNGYRVYSHNGNRFDKYEKEPFQVGFMSIDSNAPFIRATTVGTGTGTISVSGTWTKKLPELYRICFTNSGTSGTANYYFQIKKHTGFYQFSLTSRPLPIPWKHLYTRPHPNHHGWQSTNSNILLYSETQIIQYDATGITLLDLWNGGYKTWDSANEMNATNICQVCIKGTSLYVACRDTGIWVLEIEGTGIGNPVTTPCYGIDLAQGNEIWAVLNGRLSSEVSGFTTAAVISITNWSRVRFLKCDRSHSDGRFLICISDNDSDTTRSIIWWNRTSTITTTGISGFTTLGLPNSVGQDSLFSTDGWVISNGSTLRLTNFGSNTSSSLTGVAVGQVSRPCISFCDNQVIARDGLYNSSGTLQYGFTSNILGWVNQTDVHHFFHLEGGICYVGRNSQTGILIQVQEGTSGWKTYGWNGSSWVIQSSPSAKTTNSVSSALINGVSIGFTSASVNPALSFINGEYYYFSVNWGLLKTNSREFSSTWNFYTKQLVKVPGYSVTISSTSITLPVSTNPLFITLEVDSPDMHSFKIDGVPVSRVYTDSTPPALGEIRITGTGNIYFNAGDVGKTFLADYYWLSD